jgi:hypothetical protein
LVSAKEIPPGGVGEVKASFQSKGYQGKVQKAITVETNDPDNPRVRLSIAGEVVAEVAVTPRYVNFGNVGKGEPSQPISLEVELREDKQLKIREVSVDNPHFLLERKTGGDRRAVYDVSVAGNAPAGRLTGKIHVRTNSSKSPDTQVLCYAFVQGRVVVTPQILSFGLIRPGEPSSREITLRATGNRGFSVERIHASTEAIRSEIHPDPEGKVVRVRVTYDPGARTQGRVSETLKLFLGGGEEEVVEVPVHGTIHPAPEAQMHPVPSFPQEGVGRGSLTGIPEAYRSP